MPHFFRDALETDPDGLARLRTILHGRDADPGLRTRADGTADRAPSEEPGQESGKGPGKASRQAVPTRPAIEERFGTAAGPGQARRQGLVPAQGGSAEGAPRTLRAESSGPGRRDGPRRSA